MPLGILREDKLLPFQNYQQSRTLQLRKEMLHALIKQASGKTGRRLKQLNISQVVQLIAERSNDFSPLRGLRAFHEFELELGDLIRRQT